MRAELVVIMVWRLVTGGSRLVAGLLLPPVIVEEVHESVE